MKCGAMRTFGLLRKRYQQFLAAGGKLADASKHANVIHLCLIDEADAKRVIDVLPPPELHLLMGVTNALIDLLIKIFSLEFVEKWLNSHGILRHGYQGGGLDGNNSMKALKNVSSLEMLLPDALAPIIDCFRALEVVVKGQKR